MIFSYTGVSIQLICGYGFSVAARSHSMRVIPPKISPRSSILANKNGSFLSSIQNCKITRMTFLRLQCKCRLDFFHRMWNIVGTTVANRTGILLQTIILIVLQKILKKYFSTRIHSWKPDLSSGLVIELKATIRFYSGQALPY